jgi:ABC-type branched-subunit amino acid transport system substrate-binding protein
MRTMTSMGANVVANASYQSGAVTGAVDKVLAATPQSILIIGDANGAASVIRDLRAKAFRGPIYGFSNTGESLLAEELGKEGAGVVVVRVVPKSNAPNIPVVRDLMQDAQAAKLGKTNVYMLEGYLAARAYTEALRRAGREPTRAKFKQSLAKMADVSLGGFRVDFADERTGSKLVELSLIDSQGKVRE